MNLFTWPTFLFSRFSPRSMITRSLLLETTLYGSGSYVADNLLSLCFINSTLYLSDTSESGDLLFAFSAPRCFRSASWSRACWSVVPALSCSSSVLSNSGILVLIFLPYNISAGLIPVVVWGGNSRCHGFPSVWATRIGLSNDLFCRSASPFALGHKGIVLLCLFPSSSRNSSISWLTKFDPLSVRSVSGIPWRVKCFSRHLMMVLLDVFRTTSASIHLL